MTHRQDVVRGRDVAARWCALAEQRLEHLTEMFETGRWRRYHSELAFLENIQEAKRAVQTWRALATGEEAPVAGKTGAFPLGWTPAAPSRGAADLGQTMQPKAVHVDVETSVPVELDTTTDGLAEITEAPIVPDAELLAASPERVIEFTFSLDGIEAKYPLLRNTF